jgi:hypothetical protein
MFRQPIDRRPRSRVAGGFLRKTAVAVNTLAIGLD